MRAEIEAIQRIFDSETQIIGGDIVDAEISRTRDEERRTAMQILIEETVDGVVRLDDGIEARGRELALLGFHHFDALHIASAEAGNADAMLTTDQRLLRRAVRFANVIKVEIANPADWVLRFILS